jgi:hypothetical protein
MHSPCVLTQLNKLMEGPMANAISLSGRALRTAATALALATAAMSSHAAIQVFTSGATFYKRVITNTGVNILSTASAAATTFANVPSTLTTVFVPGGASVLVSVNFDAEARCNGGNKSNNPITAADINWCELMVMIGGVEGSPQASTTDLDSTYSFTSTDSGEATFATWRGHAMSRHRCIVNTSAVPMAVPVVMQWKIVVNSGGQPALAPATEFWLDDSAMVVTMSNGCAVTAVNSPSDGLAPTPGSGQSQGQSKSEKR